MTLLKTANHLVNIGQAGMDDVRTAAENCFIRMSVNEQEWGYKGVVSFVFRFKCILVF